MNNLFYDGVEGNKKKGHYIVRGKQNINIWEYNDRIVGAKRPVAKPRTQPSKSKTDIRQDVKHPCSTQPVQIGVRHDEFTRKGEWRSREREITPIERSGVSQ